MNLSLLKSPAVTVSLSSKTLLTLPFSLASRLHGVPHEKALPNPTPCHTGSWMSTGDDIEPTGHQAEFSSGVQAGGELWNRFAVR